MTTTTNKQTFPPLLCEEILLLLRYCSLYSLLMGCSAAKLTDVLSFLLFLYKDTIAPKYTHLSKNFTHKFYFVCIILLFLPLLTLPTRQSSSSFVALYTEKISLIIIIRQANTEPKTECRTIWYGRVMVVCYCIMM